MHCMQIFDLKNNQTFREDGEFSSKLTQINLIYHKSEFRVGFSYLFLGFRQLLVRLSFGTHRCSSDNEITHEKNVFWRFFVSNGEKKMSLPSLFVGLFKRISYQSTFEQLLLNFYRSFITAVLWMYRIGGDINKRI